MKSHVRRSLITLGVIVAAVPIVLLIYLRVAGRDTAPPDDSHLHLTRLSLSETNNAFTIFCVATNMWFREAEYEDKLEPLLKGTLWDEEAANKVIVLNDALFQAIEVALTWPYCQVDELDDVAAVAPYLAPWRRIAQLMELRAKVSLHRKQEDEAFKQALTLVHFGHRIENCGGAIIHYLVGLSFKHMGLLLIEGMLPDTALNAKQLRAHAAALESFGANEQGLINAFKIEYRTSIKSIAKLASGEMTADEWGLETEGVPMRSKPIGYLLQPNATRKLFADFYTALIEAVPLTALESRERMPEVNSEPVVFPRAVLKPNAIGRALQQLMLPDAERLLERKQGEQLFVDAVRLQLLLKAHEMEHGALPDSLEELVPEVLKAVPPDPFDGRPIRYSAEKRILYSVGHDLMDGNGSTTTSSPSENLSPSQKRWVAQDIIFEVP